MKKASNSARKIANRNRTHCVIPKWHVISNITVMSVGEALGAVHLRLFLPSMLLVVAVPSPVVLFIVSKSITHGIPTGLVSIIGAVTAGFIHVLSAALGLSAILMSSPLLFDLVKYLGAAYLFFMGFQRLIQPSDMTTEFTGSSGSWWKCCRDAFMVGLLNPKTAIFLLALLPQFVNPKAPLIGLQTAFLGCIFLAFAAVVDVIWACASGAIGSWLRRNPSVLAQEKYVSGVCFIVLGFIAATASTGG